MKEATMMSTRVLATCALGVVMLVPGIGAQELLPSHALGAQRFAQYRNFALKSDLATVSTAVGIASTGATTIHQRPALMQDLQWRPSRWVAGPAGTSTDPVEQIVFSFYNNQLFRVVVDYGHDRTQGMTDVDMIEAISAVYGTPGRRMTAVASQVETESGSPVARWGDAARAIVLYRTSTYGDAFRLIVTESDLARLARKAEVEAARLDERDAPRLENARQKKERDDGRAAAEKARVANKKVFRP
jgi:hypothetical protein